MTRHGKNATANSVYSYAERVKDAKLSGWGTLRQRLSKDSIKGFDCCSLTLQPCQEPVVTTEGHIFDKFAILEYILHQKQENARKLKEWEKQCERETADQAEAEAAVVREKLKKFIKHEATPTVHRAVEELDAEQPSGSGNDGYNSVSNMAGVKRKQMPSFWTPDQATDAKKSKMDKKPSNKVMCPMSGKTLKLKDLIPVKFTPMPDDDDRPDVAKQVRYMCAVSHDALTNSTLCAVLKPSGSVVTLDTVKRVIRKDMKDPITSTPLQESDIIELKRGGTGYSSTNEALESAATNSSAQLA